MIKASSRVIFFALVWVTLQIISAPNFNNNGQSVNNGALGFINSISGGTLDWGVSTGFIFHYIVALGFLIASLIIAKSMASSGGAAVSGAVNAGTKLAGRAVFGGTAMLGRNTLGWAAENTSARLKEGADNNAFTRFLYKGTSKVAKSSFQPRAGSATGAITGSLGDLGKAKDGGYRKSRADNVRLN